MADCSGHICEGELLDGYCERHRYLAPPKEEKGTRSPVNSLVEFEMRHSGRKGRKILEMFLDAVHAMASEIEPHKVAEKIIQETCKLVSCERATLYYVDGDELVLMIAKGAKNMRFPKSRGIAGFAATQGSTVSVPDPYNDERFDSTFDKSSGFVTRNILATPVLHQEGTVIAVLQCINKIGGPFQDGDVILLENVASHCSVMLRNAQLYQVALRAEQKVSSLLEIVQMLHSDPNITSLIFTLSTRSHQLVDADRCTLYLVDRARSQLVVMQGDVDIRVPLSKGIAGYVATTGKPVNIDDCYQDTRFNKAVDLKTGYRTKSMLCLPMSVKTEVIGVLQIINKLDEGVFGPEDIRTLSVLLNIAGPILQKSNFLASGGRKQTSTPGNLPHMDVAIANVSPRAQSSPRVRPTPPPMLGGISE